MARSRGSAKCHYLRQRARIFLGGDNFLEIRHSRRVGVHAERGIVVGLTSRVRRMNELRLTVRSIGGDSDVPIRSSRNVPPFAFISENFGERNGRIRKFAAVCLPAVRKSIDLYRGSLSVVEAGHERRFIEEMISAPPIISATV